MQSIMLQRFAYFCVKSAALWMPSCQLPREFKLRSCSLRLRQNTPGTVCYWILLFNYKCFRSLSFA